MQRIGLGARRLDRGPVLVNWCRLFRYVSLFNEITHYQARKVMFHHASKRIFFARGVRFSLCAVFVASVIFSGYYLLFYPTARLPFFLDLSLALFVILLINRFLYVEYEKQFEQSRLSVLKQLERLIFLRRAYGSIVLADLYRQGIIDVKTEKFDPFAIDLEKDNKLSFNKSKLPFAYIEPICTKPSITFFEFSLYFLLCCEKELRRFFKMIPVVASDKRFNTIIQKAHELENLIERRMLHAGMTNDLHDPRDLSSQLFNIRYLFLDKEILSKFNDIVQDFYSFPDRGSARSRDQDLRSVRPLFKDGKSREYPKPLSMHSVYLGQLPILDFRVIEDLRKHIDVVSRFKD